MLIISSVHFLFIVFMIMLSLVMALIIAVLIYNFLEYKQSLRIIKWSDIINRKISEVIVYWEEGSIDDDDQFKILSQNASFRNLFLQKLVDSEKKFSGGAKDKIKSLFNDYNLQKEALKKLNQKKPHLIVRGITELTVMDVEDAVPKITTFLLHPSIQVYQEAQYAMVRFKGFEGLYFLEKLSSKISEWQQLRLLLSISSIPENSDATIGKWLESTNDSVVIFVLKLIKKFQMLTLYSKTIELLNRDSVKVRIEVIKVLMSLENPETVAYLSEIYDEQPEEVKLEILRVIQISKDQCCTDLLKDELKNELSPGIKVNAAQALYKLGHQDYLSELAHREDSSEELIQIVKYALQEKVC
ncbi:HEAT repeat domain-containing protein [Chryseobacterium lineare]